MTKNKHQVIQETVVCYAFVISLALSVIYLIGNAFTYLVLKGALSADKGLVLGWLGMIMVSGFAIVALLRLWFAAAQQINLIELKANYQDKQEQEGFQNR